MKKILFGIIIIAIYVITFTTCDTGVNGKTDNGDENEDLSFYTLVIKNRTSVYRIIDLQVKNKTTNENYGKNAFLYPWVDIEPGQDLRCTASILTPGNYEITVRLVEGRINPFNLTGSFTFEKGKTTVIEIIQTGSDWGTIINK
jgi:hypothetical protein